MKKNTEVLLQVLFGIIHYHTELQKNFASKTSTGNSIPLLQVWERQMRTARRILDTLLREHGSRIDYESLQTVMCEVESIINSRPLTVISSDVKDPYPLSPNQILTMKTCIVLPPPGKFQRNDVYKRRRWRRVQYLCNLFLSRWKPEYLPTLQERAK